MLEGEKQALLQQVTVHIEATERRLRALGLKHVKVGLFDERTFEPIGHYDYLIDMAEGRCPKCQQKVDAPSVEHKVDCPLVPKPSEGGAPIERTEGPGQ